MLLIILPYKDKVLVFNWISKNGIVDTLFLVLFNCIFLILLVIIVTLANIEPMVYIWKSPVILLQLLVSCSLESIPQNYILLTSFWVIVSLL